MLIGGDLNQHGLFLLDFHALNPWYVHQCNFNRRFAVCTVNTLDFNDHNFTFLARPSHCFGSRRAIEQVVGILAMQAQLAGPEHDAPQPPLAQDEVESAGSASSFDNRPLRTQ